MAHFGDPQVLQEGERGAHVLIEGKLLVAGKLWDGGQACNAQLPLLSLPEHAPRYAPCPLASMSPCLGVGGGMVLLILLWAGIQSLASQGAGANPLPCFQPLRAS